MACFGVRKQFPRASVICPCVQVCCLGTVPQVGMLCRVIQTQLLELLWFCHLMPRLLRTTPSCAAREIPPHFDCSASFRGIPQLLGFSSGTGHTSSISLLPSSGAHRLQLCTSLLSQGPLPSCSCFHCEHNSYPQLRVSTQKKEKNRIEASSWS